MKNKYTLLKYLGIAGLVFITFLYLAFYFLPTLKAINRLKRDTREQSRQIDDYRRTAASFIYPDERERQLLAGVDPQVRERLPPVHDREEYIALFTRVFADVEARARLAGVTDLVLTSLGPDLQSNAAPLSSAKSVQDELLAHFGSHLGELQNRPDDPLRAALAAPAAKNPFLDIERLNFQPVYLTFSAPLPRLLTFVNRLPRSPVQLEIDHVWIGEGSAGALVLVELRVYFLDLRPSDAQ